MAQPQSAPVLSTPASRIVDEGHSILYHRRTNLSEEQFCIKYEIERTIQEIRAARYKRVALQFPDDLLPDAPQVSRLLRGRLKAVESKDQESSSCNTEQDDKLSDVDTRLCLLGDTSYGACCVDEVAAEHIDAEAVVHYGRTCLSPTVRLPVIYVFTKQDLDDIGSLCQSFKQKFRDKDTKIIVMADAPYQHKLHAIVGKIAALGYKILFEAEVKHQPDSMLPNRTIPEEVRNDQAKLKEWHVFHVSTPPESLLLTLSSRVASMTIYPTDGSASGLDTKPDSFFASRALNRRYALLTSVSTVPIFGVLINTLSVKNYMQIISHVKDLIAAAGRKSYTFVVGKLNAAKIANFSEIGAWVIVGCWESSLIDSKDFWKPIITPFELELALKADDEREWTGEWSGNYQAVLDSDKIGETHKTAAEPPQGGHEHEFNSGDIDSEPESEPPLFDLRSGKYVSNTKPMRGHVRAIASQSGQVHALQKLSKGDLISMGAMPSPGANHLHNSRTWRGLGTDFDPLPEEIGSVVEEGRKGIARGYRYEETGAKS